MGILDWLTRTPKPPYTDIADKFLYGEKIVSEAPPAAKRYSSDGICHWPDGGPPADDKATWEYFRFCHRGREACEAMPVALCAICGADSPGTGPTPLQQAMRAVDNTKCTACDGSGRGQGYGKGLPCQLCQGTGHVGFVLQRPGFTADPETERELGEFVRPGELPGKRPNFSPNTAAEINARTAKLSDAGQATTLRAAINYALDYDSANGNGLEWLRAWNEGDPEAMAELSTAMAQGEIF